MVQASHPSNIKETMETYNGEIFDQNSQRNILADQTNKLDFMLTNLLERIESKDDDVRQLAESELKLIQARMNNVVEKQVVTETKIGTSIDPETQELRQKDGKIQVGRKANFFSPSFIVNSETFIPGESKVDIVFDHKDGKKIHTKSNNSAEKTKFKKETAEAMWHYRDKIQSP